MIYQHYMYRLNSHDISGLYVYDLYPIGSLYAIYGNMDPINIPHLC